MATSQKQNGPPMVELSEEEKADQALYRKTIADYFKPRQELSVVGIIMALEGVRSVVEIPKCLGTSKIEVRVAPWSEVTIDDLEEIQYHKIGAVYSVEWEIVRDEE